AGLKRVGDKVVDSQGRPATVGDLHQALQEAHFEGHTDHDPDHKQATVEKAATEHADKAIEVMGFKGKADSEPAGVSGAALDQHLHEAYFAGAVAGGAIGPKTEFEQGDRVKHGSSAGLGEGVVLHHAATKPDWHFVKFPGDPN